MARLLKDLSRRQFLKTAGSATAVALAAPAFIRSASAADMLAIGDAGGAYTAAWTKAFYEPFQAETGVAVIPVERRDNPAAEVRAVVETGNYRWDLCASIGQDVAHTLVENDLLEPLDLSSDDVAAIPDTMKDDHFIASDVAAFILAYRTDAFHREITSYADMWDVEGFPGRRGMRQFARDTIQIALLADGVPLAEIPTVLADEAGWARAFAKLDAIRPNVDVWWSSASQTPTLLQTRETDICPTFNSRAQSVIDAGSPVKIVWNGGFFTNFGWVIPKGSPKADLARQFISFCADPERQAVACGEIGIGPSNPGAFDFIDPARSASLPTLPENLAQMGPLDFRFWGPVQEQAAERFNNWLLS
ncbi:polyamine ABC transporter substrate-binding protein [Devosia submarina]|uniref:polyamine ABC transporter substrate-binding protein n=1 Tax=Devosia submarina TaxID=1173082 RepID=UPI000D3615F2|nr:polyamine ABC transporter substrate-binding protein [Devosia submarina]